MTLKKKIGIAIVAVCISIVLGSFYTLYEQGSKGDKEITITIIDETTKKTLYDETVSSDTQTLADLLQEQKQVKAVIESSSLGGLLTSLMDMKQDMDKGPWWLFTSKNNKQCVEQNICPAIDQVTLFDQDAFTFTYTSDIGF